MKRISYVFAVSVFAFWPIAAIALQVIPAATQTPTTLAKDVNQSQAAVIPGQTLDRNERAPKTDNDECARGIVAREKDKSQVLVKVGELDMVSSKCLPPLTELTVPNKATVIVYLNTPGTECHATPTFTSDPKSDYIALFMSLLTAEKFAEEGAVTSEHQKIPVPGATNGTMPLSLTCQSAANKPIISRTVIVHYRQLPLFSASAGVLVSTLGKRIYGVKTNQTGVATSGIATTVNLVAVTSSSRVQFVPIAFLNWNFRGSDTLHAAFESGIGINPNGSKTNVEYSSVQR